MYKLFSVVCLILATTVIGEVIHGQQVDNAIFYCRVNVPGPSSLAVSFQDRSLSETAAYAATAPSAVNVKKIGESSTAAYNLVEVISRQGLIEKLYNIYKDIIANSPYADSSDRLAKGIQCQLIDFVNEELLMDIIVKLAQGGPSASMGPAFITYSEIEMFKARRRLQSSGDPSTTSLYSPFMGYNGGNSIGTPSSLSSFPYTTSNIGNLGFYPTTSSINYPSTSSVSYPTASLTNTGSLGLYPTSANMLTRPAFSNLPLQNTLATGNTLGFNTLGYPSTVSSLATTGNSMPIFTTGSIYPLSSMNGISGVGPSMLTAAPNTFGTSLPLNSLTSNLFY